MCCYHDRLSFHHGELDSQPDGFIPSELTSAITPFLACMRGTETGLGRCLTLHDDGRCAIYSHRPSTCREFRAFQDDGSPHPECQLYRIGEPST